MSYQGEWIEDGTHYFQFTTVDGTGAPTVLTGTPVLRCYKDGSTTQSTAGLTVTADFDSLVGLNLVTVVLTDAFYVAGADYQIVLQAGTVDSVSMIGYVVGEFSIANREVNTVKTVATTTTNTDMLAATAIVSSGAITTSSGAVSTVTTTTTATNLTNLPTIPADWLTAAGTAADFGTEVGTAVWATTTRILTASTNFNDLSAAEVNSEVDDVMSTDTQALPGQTAPSLTPTIVEMITWLYKNFRNRKTQTATQWSLLADDESTVDSKATVSDDATTAIKQEIVSGP